MSKYQTSFSWFLVLKHKLANLSSILVVKNCVYFEIRYTDHLRVKHGILIHVATMLR